MDPTALLAMIEAAIEALLTGGASSYSIGSRTVTKLDLADLMEQRRMLQAEVSRQSSGMFRVAKLRRPSR